MSVREREVLGRYEPAQPLAPRFADERITMAHGAGGRATQALVRELFLPAYGSAALERFEDAGRLGVDGTRLAVTTDSFVVKPLRFPGGSIGTLAVNGKVNDLAAMGAAPVALTIAFVLEEGLPAGVLRAEVDAVAAAARAAGVEIVAGDTRVVERGRADGMYVCTTGIGRLDARARFSAESLRPGDRLLVSGHVGDHGIAVMEARGEIELEAPVESDTRSLWPAVAALLDAAGDSLRCLRDATRGGVATVLNQLATASGVGVLIDEARVPVRAAVARACERLGIDPLYVANEGRLVAVVAEQAAGRALEALRAVPGCEHAADIGVVDAWPAGMVLVRSGFGGRRVVELLAGDPLPRIS